MRRRSIWVSVLVSISFPAVTGHGQTRDMAGGQHFWHSFCGLANMCPDFVLRQWRTTGPERGHTCDRREVVVVPTEGLEEVRPNIGQVLCWLTNCCIIGMISKIIHILII